MKKERIIRLSIIGAIALIVIVLLLILTKHTHSFGEWEKFKDSSCSEYGIERRFCNCGEVQEKKIDKLPHTESDWIFDSEHNLKKVVCTVCSRVIKSESLKDHTHSWSLWDLEKEPTCTVEGINSRSCECGAKDIISIAALGHNFNDWITVNEAKCELDGIEERICSRCNYKDTEIIPALAHEEGDWVVIGAEKQYPCIHCGKILKTEVIAASQNLEIIYGAVLGMGSCSDKNIVIPSSFENYGVYLIGEQAFEYEDIISIIIPDTVTEIKENAFYQCSSLDIVKLGQNLIRIEKKAFFKCTSINNISLPDSLKYLGAYAFAYCTNLESIYIGNSITKLEAKTFQDCKNLTSIHFNGTREEWNSIPKDIEWDLGTPDYIVYCTDGNLEK